MEHVVTLFEQVLSGYSDFGDDILSWLRDAGLVEGRGIEVLEETNFTSLSQKRANEGAESSGDNFPYAWVQVSSPLKLLGQWHLGTAPPRTQKTRRRSGHWGVCWLLLTTPFT